MSRKKGPSRQPLLCHFGKLGLVLQEVKPDDLDDTERLPKEHRSGAERSGAPVERAARPCDQESEAWPQLFPPVWDSTRSLLLYFSTLQTLKPIPKS